MSVTADNDITSIRRRQILVGTAQCIRRQGFDRVRLRDVSRESGVSIGLIQHYFETRDGLLEEAVAFQSDQLIERLRDRSAGEQGWRRLQGLFDELYGIEDLSEHATMWVSLAGAAMRHPELVARHRRIHMAWRELVGQAVQQSVEMGEIAQVEDVEDRIACLLAFFDGYEFQMATGDIPSDHDEFRRRARLLAMTLFGYEPKDYGH